MSNNFQETVNLKEKAKRNSQTRSLERPHQIDHLYNKEKTSADPTQTKNELQKIHKPVAIKINEGIFKKVILLLAVILISGTIYFLFLNKGEKKESINSGWYAVKLVNGDVFYGQIQDTASDPVVIENVYYNYDQAKDDKNGANEGGNLRLVKRGQETHGPEGIMNIVRSQILYMEPLKNDSKVLGAILDYEQ